MLSFSPNLHNPPGRRGDINLYPIVEEKSDFRSLLGNLFKIILIENKLWNSNRSKEIKKNLRKKIEKRLFSSFNRNFFGNLDNSDKIVSFLMFCLKNNWKKKLDKWIPYLIIKKPFSVNFWQLCVLQEWKTSKHSKNLDKLINLGLNVASTNKALLKFFFRSKIFFFKETEFRFFLRINKKTVQKTYSSELLFIIFCSILKQKIPEKLISSFFQIYAKETWSFLPLAVAFKKIKGVLNAKYSHRKVFLKIISLLFIPFFFSECLVKNKILAKTEFYSKILNPQWKSGLSDLLKSSSSLKTSKRILLNSKKKNSSQIKKTFQFLK